VVAVPTAVLYDNQEAGASQVRFAFCKRTEVLEEALTRLARLTRPG
jgi:N-succinyldiaminopimelate aminotransferase